MRDATEKERNKKIIIKGIITIITEIVAARFYICNKLFNDTFR